MAGHLHRVDAATATRCRTTEGALWRIRVSGEELRAWTARRCVWPSSVAAQRAELLAGILRSHGLQAAVSADDAGGQYPQMQIDGVRVLVAPSDEASARRLLAAADDIDGPDGGS